MSLVASRVDSIGMQYNVIEKEIQYVRKVLKKQSASRPDSMVPDSEYGAGDLTRLDDEEYKDQLENARSLVEVLSKEVEVLQESMSSILDETVTSHDEKPRKSTQLLQRQVSELRKVWAHEVSANSILRNLVSKCQSDSARTEDKLHKQYDSLREEFDELAELYDSSRNEIDLLRSEALIREKDLISLKARIQTDASSFLSRGETDEVARRERFAMNELVRSLEQQRDKLLEDVKQIATFKEQSEKLAKDLDSAQSDLSASQQKVADLETALVTAKSDAEKSERTLLLEKTVDEERELSEVSRKRSNDLQTKLDNLLRTNLSLTMDCKNALLKVAELEAQLTAAPSASALDDLSQSKREYEEKIAEILAAKSRLEKTLSQKELEWESERLKFRAQLKEASSTKNQDFISLSAEKADASLKLAERDADLKAAKLRTAELKSQLDRLTAEKTTKTKELENELSQAKAQATAAAEQATNERAKAKKLARKVEDLRSRVVELKDDKTKLESVVNGKEQSAKLYEDLQNCLKEYRSLKGLYDQTVQWVKLALEKTTGETDIEVFDQEAKQLRVDIDRWVSLS